MNDFETVTRFACDETGSLTEKTHFTIDILFAKADGLDTEGLRGVVKVTLERLLRGRKKIWTTQHGGTRRILMPFVMNRYIETRSQLTANPPSFTAIIAYRTVEGVDFQRFYANFEYRLAEGGAVHVHVSVTYWQQLPASANDAYLFNTSRFSQQEVFDVGEDTVRAFAREQQEGFDQVRADMQQDEPINVELVGTDFGLMNVAYPPNPFGIAFQFQRFLLPEMLANSAVDLRGPAIENYFMSVSTERLPYPGGHVLETERRFRKRHHIDGLEHV